MAFGAMVSASASVSTSPMATSAGSSPSVSRPRSRSRRAMEGDRSRHVGLLLDTPTPVVSPMPSPCDVFLGTPLTTPMGSPTAYHSLATPTSTSQLASPPPQQLQQRPHSVTHYIQIEHRCGDQRGANRQTQPTTCCLCVSATEARTTRSRAPPSHTQWQRQACALCFYASTILAPSLVFMILLGNGMAYAMVYALMLVLALGGWELSWWHFRIRKRLLAPFQSAANAQRSLLPPPNPPQPQPPPHQQQQQQQQQNQHQRQQVSANEFPHQQQLQHGHEHDHFDLDAARTNSADEDRPNDLPDGDYAISGITRRWCGGHTFLGAVALSVMVSAGIAGITMAFQDDVVEQEAPADADSSLGWRMLLGCAIMASLSALFCACLAPQPADGFVIFVYQGCFVVSSLNSFLAHHEHLIDDPELLDSLYVLLVGACAIVVWRIVSSKDVLQSAVMTMLDILGLAYLVAPMIAMGDILGHPLLSNHDEVVAAFFIVVGAAEAGYRAYAWGKAALPWLARRSGHPVAKRVSQTMDFESLAVSIVCAVVAWLLTSHSFHAYVFNVKDGGVLLLAVVFSQVCRVMLETLMLVASVTSSDVVERYTWIPGVMEAASPYLLAAIVFHPYVTSILM